MALHLTPAMLEASYELLRTTPPFRGWKLPHADDVEFACYRRPGYCGGIFWGGPRERKKSDRNRIRISVHLSEHVSLEALLPTMAHEMVHLRQAILKEKHLSHGKTWKLLADQVCQRHGFDRGAF